MSRRLIAASIAITLVMSGMLVLVRSFTLSSELRARQAVHVTERAELLAAVLAQRWAEDGLPPTEAELQELVGADGWISWEGVDAEPGGVQSDAVEVTGTDDELTQSADVRPASGPQAGTVVGTVTVTEPALDWRGVIGLNPLSLGMLLVLFALAAGLAGYVMSRWLSAPFSRLAGAAAMLGRGRFDLELPRNRIPEAQAVSSALEASAAALREQLTREQQFSTHASHVLRTPLTSLRLHLEELDLSDLDPDSRETARRCLRSVAQLDQVVVDLVDITRRGSVMSGAEIPLRELATSSAQRWADVLIQRGCGFSAAVEGDLDLTITPGPVEFVLDVLLEQVRAQSDRAIGSGGVNGVHGGGRNGKGGDGDVRLVFVGASDVLRIEVAVVGCTMSVLGWSAALSEARPRLDQAASLVRSLGGRIEDGEAGCVRVLIPPR